MIDTHRARIKELEAQVAAWDERSEHHETMLFRGGSGRQITTQHDVRVVLLRGHYRADW